jgi:hypothetical protein
VRGLTVRNGRVTCGVVNKSDEEVTLDEVRLQSSSYDLTEPVFPPAVEAWKIGRQCTWSIYFNCQPNPAASLIRMNDTTGLFFKTELRVVVIYSALGVSREFSQVIPVQVNVSSNEIISLV